MSMDEKSICTQWYALKVFFNKVFEIEEFLRDRGIESYYPCETIVRERNGKKKKIRRPIISSLLFFRSTEQVAWDVQALLDKRVLLYTRQSTMKKLPIAIPEHEMEIFILVSSSGEKGLEYFGSDIPDFHIGEHVVVIDGPFKGAEGYIKRIRGDHRLVVSVRGVCAVATSYIPHCFLQKI